MSTRKQVIKKKKGQTSTTSPATAASRRPTIKASDQVTDLIDLVATYELKHGYDANRSTIFMRLTSGQAVGLFPLRSDTVRNHLRVLGDTRLGRGPTSKVIDDVIEHVEARGLSLTSCPMFRRVAHVAGTIYIDLGTPDGEAIMITKQCWQVMQNPPVLFHRSNTTGVLPQPQVGGSLDLLRAHFPSVPNESVPALLGFIMSCYLPEGSFPILMVQGQHGCGKSTLTDLLRSLIDPAPGYGARAKLSEKPDDFATVVSGNFLSSFDNASRIPPDIADLLCQVSSGGELVSRKLFLQGVTFSLKMHNPLIINSVSLPLERPDLASRLVLLELDTMKDGTMASEREVRSRFAADLPKILGYIYDAIAMALRDHARTGVSPLPRLADAALFATAAEPALGLSDGSIVSAWASAQIGHAETQAANDPLVYVLTELLRMTPHMFEGTTSQFIQHAQALETTGGWKLPADFPLRASALGTHLTRNKSMLAQSGFKVEQLRRQTNHRGWKITLDGVKQRPVPAFTVTRPPALLEVNGSEAREALLTKLENTSRPQLQASVAAIGGVAA